MIEGYLLNLLIILLIYIILAISLQLSVGFTGLLNLGHFAFYGIGAYTAALLTLNGVPFWLAFLAAGLVAALFGVLLSIPTHRLSGDYLALATMGFSFVMVAIALNWTDLTRGPLGLPGIPKPELLGVTFSDSFSFMLLALGVAALSYAVIYRITRSPFGTVLQAIRDDELAAEVLGKNAFKVKTISLAVSAFFAGVAGSLFAHYITFIDPSSFGLLQLIPVLSIVILGGLASLEGTVLAAVILVLLPEPLRFIGFPSSIVGPARQFLYALIFILLLVYRPRGFLGKVALK